MFKTFKSRSGQNTAEYALLIALVIAGVVAMQTYTQRSLQAKMRDAGKFLSTNTAFAGVIASEQYEPYYKKSDYTIDKESQDNKILAEGTVAASSSQNRSRTGNEESTYDKSDVSNY